MELDPDQIRDRRFAVAVRGYDRREVALFLEQVAARVAELTAALRTAEADAARHLAGEQIANERLAAVHREVERRTASEAGMASELAAERRHDLEATEEITELFEQLSAVRAELAEARRRLDALGPVALTVREPIAPPPELAATAAIRPRPTLPPAAARPADPPPFSFEAVSFLPDEDEDDVEIDLRAAMSEVTAGGAGPLSAEDDADVERLVRDALDRAMREPPPSATD